jgi:hypothetical protein
MQSSLRASRPKIKVLGSQVVMCENRGCEANATYLFRVGNGPVASYCEVHARQQAAQWNVSLPEPTAKLLKAAW